MSVMLEVAGLIMFNLFLSGELVSLFSVEVVPAGAVAFAPRNILVSEFSRVVVPSKIVVFEERNISGFKTNKLAGFLMQGVNFAYGSGYLFSDLGELLCFGFGH